MMLKWGKLSSAVVLACLLSLVMFSTGALAQHTDYSQTNSALRRVTTHGHKRVHVSARYLKAKRLRNWSSDRRYRRGYGYHRGFSAIDRLIRVTKTIRVTQIIHVTKVRIIRITKTLHVTRLIRRAQAGGIG